MNYVSRRTTIILRIVETYFVILAIAQATLIFFWFRDESNWKIMDMIQNPNGFFDFFVVIGIIAFLISPLLLAIVLYYVMNRKNNYFRWINWCFIIETILGFFIAVYYVLAAVLMFTLVVGMSHGTGSSAEINNFFLTLMTPAFIFLGSTIIGVILWIVLSVSKRKDRSVALQ